MPPAAIYEAIRFVLFHAIKGYMKRTNINHFDVEWA
jgi:hypothetical protein